MMKLNRKYSLVAIALIAVMCTGIAYAAFTIESNEVHVTINYILSLSYTYTGSVVHLTAHLESQGSPVSGATVTFYVYGASWSSIGTAGTDASGNALLDYAVTANGDYYFKAAYAVP